MALVECPDCTAPVSTSAISCPRCGAQLASPLGHVMADLEPSEAPAWRRVHGKPPAVAAAAVTAPAVPTDAPAPRVGVVARLRGLLGSGGK